MDNREVLEQTMRSYEDANNALLTVWDQISPTTLDIMLEKQQHRLEQISERMYHEEMLEHESDMMQNTLARYEWANQYLYEHWDNLPPDERQTVMRKQWNRLEELRNRAH
ncbi:MAG: hypothetical protein JWN30_1193 [Bacilli bacterium]|nr:hypothetical protein [Bacilli bacterium]